MRLTPLTFVAVLFLAARGFAADAGSQAGHGISMYGDLKYAPGFKHFDYVNPNAPKGGELRMGSSGTFDSFNGFILNENAAPGLTYLHDTLLVASADEPFSEYGLIAEQVEVPPDRSWVTFTLRKEARFHDGKPITPEDVIWTFETLRTKGEPFYRGYYGSVEKVEKAGEGKVKFTFRPGENRELPLILGQLAVLPKHYWEGRAFDKSTLDPPVGSGAYAIDSFEAGRFVRYKRRADYWGKDLPVNVGRFNFDYLRYDIYLNETVELEAFKAGQYDFRGENSAKEWATAYDFPAVRDGRVKKDPIKHNRTAGMQGFAFNTRRPVFRDIAVREALAYAFDFEWSNKNLFYGQYTRSRSYFDNSELAARGLPEGEELKILERYRGRVPERVFTQEYQPPRTDGSGNIRDNLQKAVAILKAAGWEIDPQTRVLTQRDSKQRLEFEILLQGPIYERFTLPFVKNLERLGAKVTVRSIQDSAQYTRRIENYDYDMVIANWGQSASPGNEQRYYWTSAYGEKPGSANLAGVKDPVIDELVELLIAAPDRPGLVARTRALDRVLQWGFWVIPNWYIAHDRVAYWDKLSRPAITPDRGMQLDAWWFDAEKAAALSKKK